jgi:hypothetical protein
VASLRFLPSREAFPRHSVAAAAQACRHSLLEDAASGGVGSDSWKKVLLTTLIRGGGVVRPTAYRTLGYWSGTDAAGKPASLRNAMCTLGQWLPSLVFLRIGAMKKRDDDDDDDDKEDATTPNKKLRKRLAYDRFFLCVVLSVLSGSYTTVIFTLQPL